MSAPPPPWRLDCDHCNWFIIVAVDSGTGEQAAEMMNDHSLAAHGRPFPEIAGMKAEPYDPIVVPGDGSDEFIEYGPVTFRSLDT